MKTAVQTVFIGKQRAYNRRFLEIIPRQRVWDKLR